ncbi:hypothetical protein BV898_14501 [Hypsibius exemplaris]|uniref:Uncharacterized protein n=1 Tax=Hypsibius exemplaris TaxID=2072580 RepID=A0A9X6RJJ9_HYPEX|nr:hypothetical protein BV898_14501 [Hypsibius exemplaris]
MNAGIAMINRVKGGLPIPERVGLYHAFVEPHLDYCSSVCSTALKKLRSSIKVVQRNALRAIVDNDVVGIWM